MILKGPIYFGMSLRARFLAGTDWPLTGKPVHLLGSPGHSPDSRLVSVYWLGVSDLHDSQSMHRALPADWISLTPQSLVRQEVRVPE